MAGTKCTLEHRRCTTVGRCDGCGWEVNEIQRRKEIMEEIGLIVCEDGLSRLFVGKVEEDGEE